MVLTAIPTEAAIEKPRAYLMCRNFKSVRTLRVKVSKTGDSCKTLYSKAGVDRLVGSGTQVKSCLRFMNNVKANLEKAKWKCRDISSSQITVADAETKKE